MMKNLGFFRLVTPKTAFLVRNLPIYPNNLGILRKKQGHSFQFQKKSREGLPLLSGSLRQLTYFKVFMSSSKRCPKWLLFWMVGEIQEAKKDKFHK